MEKEVRTIPASFEVRQESNKNPVIVGRCAVYNSRSENLGGFTEIIEPGFFANVLENDVVATVEHNNEKLVGRTSAGTLKIEDSSDALTTENDIPPTTVGNDLIINAKRGEIKGMSFAFRVKSGGDKWEEDPTTGAMTRTLLAGGCERLYDVTYTCNPAYRETSFAMRSLEDFKKTKEEPFDEVKANERKRRLMLAQL